MRVGVGMGLGLGLGLGFALRALLRRAAHEPVHHELQRVLASDGEVVLPTAEVVGVELEVAGRRAIVERGRGDVGAGADRRAGHDGLGGVRVKVRVRVTVRVKVRVRLGLGLG